MSQFDPRFWEVSVDPEVLEEVLASPDFLDDLLRTPEDGRRAAEKEQRKQEAVGLILEMIRTRLTDKQRQIVEMYFFQNLTQAEIAAALGVNQQVVSKHLFGVLRGGKRVGGAMKKLRKLSEKSGIDPQKWV